MRPNRRQLILTLAGLPVLGLVAPLPAQAADAAVSIKGMKFNPADLAIAAGTTVTFTNEDGAPHTATADDGGWDTGRLKKGASAAVTFATAGTFAYHCAVHPMMKGTITVS